MKEWKEDLGIEELGNGMEVTRMETENQICKCGHGIELHNSMCDYSIDFACPCKKYRPQTKPDKKTAPKHWDDVTHVAPKGEFKAGKPSEFNLSDKFQFGEEFACGEKFYLEEDVKEFIKRLKQTFCPLSNYPCKHPTCILRNEEIDKLTGDKLI